MKSSFALLIFIPLVGALIIIAWLLNAWLQFGLRWNDLATIIFVGLIIALLIYFLKKGIGQKDTLLEYPGSEHVSPQIKKTQARYLLISTFIALGLSGFILFNILHIKNRIGIGFFVFGLIMWYFAFADIIIAKYFRTGISKDEILKHINSREILLAAQEKYQAAFIFTIILLAIASIVSFAYTNLKAYISLFDLTGILFFLTGYGAWFALRRISLKMRISSLFDQLKTTEPNKVFNSDDKSHERQDGSQGSGLPN